MDSKKYLNKICAIIVSYNADTNLKRSINTLICQVEKIIIIDNGSNIETVFLLKELIKINYQKIHLILLKQNIGLAKAQNIGLSFAIKEKFNWILLMDQDSCPQKHMINNMAIAYNNYSNKDQIAIIAPFLKETNVDQKPKYIVPHFKIWFKRKTFANCSVIDNAFFAIASGSLIKVDSILLLGKLCEPFFIDYIDLEFCMKVITNGRKILIVKNAMLEHRLGKKKSHSFLGLKIITSNHLPFRRYTIYRNRSYIWKKYFLKVPGFVFYDILSAIYDLFRIIFFEKNSKEKIILAFKGCIEGIFSSKWI